MRRLKQAWRDRIRARFGGKRCSRAQACASGEANAGCTPQWRCDSGASRARRRETQGEHSGGHAKRAAGYHRGLPLAFAAEGACVRIMGLDGGRRFNARLTALGLTRGARLRIVKRSGSQPMLLRIGDTRIALCSGMALKIFVVPDPLAHPEPLAHDASWSSLPAAETAVHAREDEVAYG